MTIGIKKLNIYINKETNTIMSIENRYSNYWMTKMMTELSKKYKELKDIDLSDITNCICSYSYYIDQYNKGNCMVIFVDLIKKYVCTKTHEIYNILKKYDTVDARYFIGDVMYCDKKYENALEILKYNTNHSRSILLMAKCYKDLGDKKSYFMNMDKSIKKGDIYAVNEMINYHITKTGSKNENQVYKVLERASDKDLEECPEMCYFKYTKTKENRYLVMSANQGYTPSEYKYGYNMNSANFLKRVVKKPTTCKELKQRAYEKLGMVFERSNPRLSYKYFKKSYNTSSLWKLYEYNKKYRNITKQVQYLHVMSERKVRTSSILLKRLAKKIERKHINGCANNTRLLSTMYEKGYYFEKNIQKAKDLLKIK